MNTYRRAMRPGLGFLAVALISLMPAMASARTVRDSEEFNSFLSEAKTEAAQVQRAAEEMYTFKYSKVTWETQAAKLSEMKTHLNNLGQFVVKMNNAEAPSPWQQQAIQDITPMVEELAANTTMAIYHLDESRDAYVFSSFPEYVEANAELGADIANLISEYVDFAEAKQTVDDISFELELPTS